MDRVPIKGVKLEMKRRIILHANIEEKGIILTSNVGEGLIYAAINATRMVILQNFARIKGISS